MNSYSFLEANGFEVFLSETFKKNIYIFFHTFFFENTEQEKRKNISILWFFL